MILRALPLIVAAACAGTTTAANPPGAPPLRDEPYAGRIVLRAAGLRRGPLTYDEAWSQRLVIFGATARIVYDGDRAVVDVYGIPPAELRELAAALADPGGWSLTGTLARRLPPTPDCHCAGTLRFLGGSEICEYKLSRSQETRRFHRGKGEEEEAMDLRFEPLFMSLVFVGLNRSFGRFWWIEESSPREPMSKCPGDTFVPEGFLIALDEGTTPAEARRIALALGGGTLPGPVSILSVTP